MNKKMKKGVFWGVMMAAVIVAFNVLHYLLGGGSTFAAGPYGHGHGPGGMGTRGGFGSHSFMNGPHPGGGFSWLLLLIGLAVLFFLVRWFRTKAKASSMQQFIDTPLMDSHTPVANQNSQLLDQWEKTIMTKKEND
ncbi:hypothetical protein QFZ87_000069 [Bacillus sp. SLBN-46]|uniref:hypothetical protein n=1 Tax=Bacillus sp. SLBN-46 TaxID=3042283 RepID=UPI002862E4CA|nr:hypothetical protein [Bacillus sp. SLBN-46]MDR6120472.1 hypothetical protein [Bacillus sp. SLBN-46]